MTSATISVAEHLYDLTVDFTKVTEYGSSLEAIAAGETTPPPEGARFDVAFEGVVRGSKLKGAIAGVDYINIRADGRSCRHL